jgi:hypothetical protein
MAELNRAGGVKDRDDFVRLLSVRFPEVAAEIGDTERGLLHLEMAALARATCPAIDVSDFERVQDHFGFVDELLSDADPALANAVYVSYLENVFLGQTDPRFVLAQTMLSQCLQTALTDLKEDFERIAEWKARQDLSQHCG